MSIDTEIREYLAAEMSKAEIPVQGDTNLIEAGVLDSLGLMDLVSMIEERYEVEIDDEELVVENFESLDKITGLIDAKRAG